MKRDMKSDVVAAIVTTITTACVMTVGYALFPTSLSAQELTTQETYVRYTRPGQCVQAAKRISQLYWRARRPDTVVYAPATDSVPEPVLRHITSCGARFDVTKLPERDLLSLVQMYLWSGQEAQTRSAIDQLLTSLTKKGDVERGWVMGLLVTNLIKATPSQLSNAQYYLTKLDSLSMEANYAKMLAHQTVSDYFLSIGDLANAVTEAKTAIAYSQQMPLNDKLDFITPMAFLYGALAEPLSATEGGSAALAVFERAVGDFSYLPAGSQAQMMAQQRLQGESVPYTLIGSPGQPIQATYWYNKGSDTIVLPTPGAVTLLYFGSSSCGGACFSQYATLQRLYDKYANQGLRIVFTTSTYGYFRNQLQPNPAEESEKHRGYFLDYLKLPYTLSIEETKFTKRRDGRRVNEPVMNQRNYGRMRNAVLIGKDGKVRLVASVMPQREKLFDEEIAKALRM